MEFLGLLIAGLTLFVVWYNILKKENFHSGHRY